MLDYFPKYFSNKAIILYYAVLLSVSLLFLKNAMNWYWFLFGTVEVVSFFYFSNLLTKRWSNYSTKLFTKKLFYSSLIIRISWVLFSYVFFLEMTGQPFDFGAADSLFYDELGRVGSELISNGVYNVFPGLDKYAGGLGFSDSGYPTYISFIYFFTGKSVLILRLLKTLFGAWTCVLVFKLATRNFGENTGRIAAVFCMLMPNLIYYCGLHLKEVEMVFLTVLFVERADNVLRIKQFNFGYIFIPMLITLLLFSLRTPLGISSLFALFSALLVSSTEIIKLSKRVVISVWIIGAIAYFVGGTISVEVENLWVARQTNQKETLEWRAKREFGNSFATYASSAIFAPLIFIIPIPTEVDIPSQQEQQLLHGGNFVKEIMAFFVLFALFWLITKKKWRDFSLIGAFMLGYLIIIALSAFAQSERFHQPALPFILMFAAFGISKTTNQTKQYFTWYMFLLFVVIIFWNWFKLAGRGIV